MYFSIQLQQAFTFARRNKNFEGFFDQLTLGSDAGQFCGLSGSPESCGPTSRQSRYDMGCKLRLGANRYRRSHRATPHSGITSKTLVWSWADVVRWLYDRKVIEERTILDKAEIVRDINDALEVKENPAIIDRRLKYLRELGGRKSTAPELPELDRSSFQLQFNILKRRRPNPWMSIHKDGSNQSFSVLFENESSASMNHSNHRLSNIGCTR